MNERKMFIDEDGWKYSICYKGGVDTFQIIPPDNKKRNIKKTLYKYLPLNNKSIELYEKSQLYTSYPEKFNDPFECCYNLFNCSLEQINNFLRLIGKTEVEIKSGVGIKQFCLEFLRNEMNIFTKQFGLIPLSENIHSIPMWAYYASYQEGFALGYNKDKLKKNLNGTLIGPFQIHYKESHNKRPDYSDFLYQHEEGSKLRYNFYLAMLYLTNIKSSQWENELEWRFLCSIKNEEQVREIDYNSEVLDEIVLGLRFFDPRGVGADDLIENSNIIYDLSRDENKNFKLRILKRAFGKINLSAMVIKTITDFSMEKRTINLEFITDEKIRVEYK